MNQEKGLNAKQVPYMDARERVPSREKSNSKVGEERHLACLECIKNAER